MVARKHYLETIRTRVTASVFMEGILTANYANYANKMQDNPTLFAWFA
jgi:hypothetical protein